MFHTKKQREEVSKAIGHEFRRVFILCQAGAFHVYNQEKHLCTFTFRRFDCSEEALFNDLNTFTVTNEKNDVISFALRGKLASSALWRCLPNKRPGINEVLIPRAVTCHTQTVDLVIELGQCTEAYQQAQASSSVVKPPEPVTLIDLTKEERTALPTVPRPPIVQPPQHLLPPPSSRMTPAIAAALGIVLDEI